MSANEGLGRHDRIRHSLLSGTGCGAACLEAPYSAGNHLHH